MTSDRARRLLLPGGLVVAACIYLLAVNPLVGEGYDDGHYLTLAQALANGRGFTRISAPGQPPETLYPPGWPMMLAPLWWLHTPGSTDYTIFKLASVALTLALGVLTYGWLRWRGTTRTLSTYVVLLTLFSPRIFSFSTILFSEMAYACVSVAALWAVEYYAQTSRAKWTTAILPALAVITSVYIRTFGLALVAASLIFLMARRQWKHAIWFAALALFWCSPWLVRGALTANSASDYAKEFWLKSIEQPELGTVSSGELAVRVLLNMRTYLMAGLPGAIFPSQIQLTYVNLPEALRLGAPWAGSDVIIVIILVAGLVQQFWQQRGLAGWYVVIYLGVALLWPWEPTRLVVPLIPLLWMYFLTEISHILNLLTRQRPHAYATLRHIGLIALSVFILMNVATLGSYALNLRQTNAIPSDWESQQRLFDWIERNTPRDSRFGTMNDYQIYLYTGRLVMREIQSEEALKRDRIDYVALVPYGGVMLVGDLSRLNFEPVYHTYPQAFTRVYSDTTANIEVFHVDREQLP